MHTTAYSAPIRGARHRAVLVIMALVASMLTTGLGIQVADAAGTMTVTPSTGLIDGQSVHVVATGLGASRSWGMQQCVTNHQIEGCDPTTATYGPTDANGNFATDVHVQTILHTQIGTIDCRTNAEPCVLGASTSGGPDGAVSATLGFDRSGPLLPPPAVHATPDTDLIDGQVVAVDGTGFRTSYPYAEIRQCVAGATTVSQCHSNNYTEYSPINPDGTFHGSIRLHALLATDGGTTVDCRTAPHACELRVGQFYPQLDASPAALSFDPDAPALPPASITVDPDTDLIDGQTVTVTGSDFLANSPVGIGQCASSPSAGTCTGGYVLYTDADGTFEQTIKVRARMWAGEVVDCRDADTDCVVQAYSYEDGDQHPVAPIAFDPDGPLLPPPTLVATPSTDLVDGQIVSLSGTGFVNPYDPSITVPVLDGRHPHATWYSPAPVPAGWRAPTRSGAAVTHDVPPGFTKTVVECVTTEVFDIEGCDPNTWTEAPVDSDGNLTGTAQVWAVFTSFGGTTVDCRTSANACSLYSFGFDPLAEGVASIDFDPQGPLAPPPTITVTPTTGLVDHQPMHVVGDGFPADALVQLHQCKSGVTGLDGCDTDLYGVVLADELGHIDLTTEAKQNIGLGILGDPYSETFDCASAPGACRLLFSDYRPVPTWPSVTLTYASSVPPPPAQTPTAVPVAEPQFTG